MKKAQISYHRLFPWTPVSGWAGARSRGYVPRISPSGQRMSPTTLDHPFRFQRKQWCLLKVEFDGVGLVFATPQELDHFIDVLSRNPLPNGGSLIKGRIRPGKPNGHWLSRLPTKARSWKFRQKLCRYLQEQPKIGEFRAFYAEQPVRYAFEGFYDDFYEAARAQP